MNGICLGTFPLVTCGNGQIKTVVRWHRVKGVHEGGGNLPLHQHMNVITGFPQQTLGTGVEHFHPCVPLGDIDKCGSKVSLQPGKVCVGIFTGVAALVLTPSGEIKVNADVSFKV